jgi:hypothetical protein
LLSSYFFDLSVLGYPLYELKQGGSEMIVDASNVEEYIEAVVDATLHTGIKAQLQAFRHVLHPGINSQSINPPVLEYTLSFCIVGIQDAQALGPLIEP